MTSHRWPVALAAASAGGMIGALARYGLTEWFPTTDGFGWTTFAINVIGSALLAVVGGLAVVRRSPVLGVFLGAGVLGGFTTMSAASEQTVALLDRGQGLTALAYAGGTLVAALVAVMLVDLRVARADRLAAEEAQVDA